ncbi:MAG: RHS repeat-associated core domain-containing protein [Candidatus Peribacteria bacterium]|nr:RHS repeat-associated core domain-containing protein [Candidatus Peribacteria bacterium]
MNNIFFTGKFYDKEIGLYYFVARYYDSKLGRFTSRDPIGIIDDVNLYVYAGNNPLKFTDPS